MSTSFSRVQIRARTNKDALYGITRGTAAANKAVVLDANKNISGLVLGGVAPVAVGASATAVIGNTYLLNTAAGSVLTLPAATGSGGTISIIVTTTVTSNSHKVLAASSSDFIGGAAVGENAGTAKIFKSDFATNHSLQMPAAGSTPSGGYVGDIIELQDIATNNWAANIVYQAGTTPTTPFNSATS